MQSTQITCIEPGGVTRLTIYHFLFVPILILSYFPGKQLLIFQKVYLWQPSNPGC